MSRASQCAKCGSKDLYFQYHDVGEGWYGNPCYFEEGWCDKEHLDRGCRQCDYEWCEDVEQPSPSMEN